MTLLLVFGSIVVFVVLLVAFGIGAAGLTRWLVQQMVERRHRELEELVTYGRVPRAWIGRDGRSARQGAGQEASENPDELGPRARRRCRRRLDALTVEVERSTLVNDEETRRVLVERLTTVRARF